LIPVLTIKQSYNFALKVFEERYKSQYDNEIAAFRALKGHEGIIAYLGDFKQKDQVTGKTSYNILLEFGELDLDEYFFDRSPPVQASEILCFWKDLFEIARAIKNIHTFKLPRGNMYMEYYG
jgi:serine/threonine protein kinase